MSECMNECLNAKMIKCLNGYPEAGEIGWEQ